MNSQLETVNRLFGGRLGALRRTLPRRAKIPKGHVLRRASIVIVSRDSQSTFISTCAATVTVTVPLPEWTGAKIQVEEPGTMQNPTSDSVSSADRRVLKYRA